ncbi:MAG: tetratricopeptide repeat protein [Candidatus Eisenbacteria bacterium]|nr:tetratricopeptide repeat protein [Candidatus Eisenbacteria bacterium]
MKRRGDTPRGRPAAAAAPPVALGHPAMLLALAVTAVCVLVSVTFRLYDTDLWHHLLVGKVIWATHAVPTRQLWSWPTYGAPDANSAWLFRALVWPLWSAAGVSGLFVWRWLSTLAVFAITWATARRAGARGFVPLVVLLFAAFVYRIRSQIRPETMVAVLIALELLILESRRAARAALGAGGATVTRDPAPWLIAIAWVWANTHLSYYLGFIVMGVYLADEWLAARGRGASAARSRAPRVLLWTMVASLAISFVNPFGWQALWLPFDFMLHLRNELLYRTIRELEPIEWRLYIRTALPLLMAAWPLLIAWRLFRRDVDRVEILLCLLFTPIALSTQRFVGFYVVIAAPFVMRDLDLWIGARSWPPRDRLGARRRWAASPWLRAGATIAICAGAGVLEWNRPGPAAGVGIEWSKFPVRACDWIAAHGIRGRGFNNFEYGPYQAWRFWPDRGRLPFMTGTIEVATPTDRMLYAGAFAEPGAWRALDRLHHFDYVMVQRVEIGTDRLLDVLDADSTWALVFADDAAAVFVRRGGALDSTAARDAYRLVPAGVVRLEALGAAVARDTVLRARVVAELDRQVADSPWNANALSLLANLDLVAGRYGAARSLLARALRVDPTLGRAHERLGIMAMDEGRTREAIAEFERERALNPHLTRVALRLGRAWQRLGDPGKARAWYRRELEIDPGSEDARRALEALGGP